MIQDRIRSDSFRTDSAQIGKNRLFPSEIHLPHLEKPCFEVAGCKETVV